MGQRKDVKMDDIAQALGVSTVSVFNSLKGKKGVSDALRARVLGMAETMGYQAPPPASGAKRGGYKIGVIVAERYVKEYPSFYMEVYQQLARLAD